MDEVRVYFWTRDFERAEDDVPPGQGKRYRYFCLACLAIEGIERRVTSDRFLCRTHAALFREWRNRVKGESHVC
jgi:hypothetical protein